MNITMHDVVRRAVLALVLVSSPAALAHALDAPPGFVVVNEFPLATFTKPTQVVFLPDGRAFIAEQRGIVQLVFADGTPSVVPFIGLGSEVLQRNDLGLLSVALDPDFESNRWVYFLYTVDPNGAPDDDVDAFSRIVRYQASASNPNVVDHFTRQVLLGSTWTEGIPSLHTSHSIGTLRFGSDKSLFVTAGDGAHWEVIDRGGLDPDAFLPGRTLPAEDMGAFRARSLNSLAGKMLRLDKETGLGLPSNPYWDGLGSSKRSRVWLYGLRNPYRFCVRPGTGSTDPSAGDPGSVYIGDVGMGAYEEVVIASQGGLNEGWPCFEGPVEHTGYDGVGSTESGNNNVLCDAGSTPENPATESAPALHWHHSDGGLSNPNGWEGSCVIGGVFYTGTSYPEAYRNRYYVADFVGDWIRAVEVDDNDQVVGWSEFITGAGSPVDLEIDPATGDLMYIAFFENEVRRVRFSSAVAVGDDAASPPPATFALESHPNPFHPRTTIRFELPAADHVRLHIYDSRGRLVRALVDAPLGPGAHHVEWDGMGADGEPADAGVYYYRMDSGGVHLARKLVRLGSER
jgi:glucose/arabinose dehydrogenase